MTEHFLKGFINNSLVKSTSSANNSLYGKTIPSIDCVNGFPIDKYVGYDINAWKALYGIWCAYQNTIGAKFTASQASTGAPVNPKCKGPSNIFIIRHGEKNPSPEVNYCLNNNGIYRSCQIIEYVNKLALSNTPISYMITCNPCPYNSGDPSMRTQQTIMMTCYMLNIPMFIYGGSQDYNTIIDKLFNSTIFDGLNILICWEHTAIQQLCLNIMNAAGLLGRLSNITPTNSNVNLYGDAYFLKYSPINNICPDGNYLCTDNSNPYYVDATAPSCIGPNSQFYPYWNIDNFESVYWFNSTFSSNYNFTFIMTREPVLTCYSNCELHIGLYQPLNIECEPSNKYYTSSNEIENKCLVPSVWIVNN